MHLSAVARSPALQPFLIGTTLLFLSGCGPSGATSAAQSRYPEFVAPGVLTVASDPIYPPQEFVGTGGAVVGFDVDLARAIAGRLGRRLRVVPTAYKDLVPALATRRVDAVISGLTLGGDLTFGVQLITYLKVSEAFVSTANSSRHVRRPEQLCGLRVGVVQSSTEADTVRGLSAPAMPCHDRPIQEVSLQSSDVGPGKLTDGLCDVLYLDGPPALALGHGRRDLAVTLDRDPVRQAFESIAVSSSDDALRFKMKDAFKKMQEEGSYRVLLAHWGLELEDIGRQTDSASY